ncbi:hypothetical protein [Nocardioides sp. L-11A]|uniref:hypothetical protein n=1 Tax=Nocardioides sp. L-11A TaxID=3043848 RepID=UPI00249C1C17|nr:hypothetical protein QJ852_05865 [Nocardioides sp. L-11A]
MLRKLLTTLAAAVLTVLAFSPAAQAATGPLRAITVGNPALPDGAYPVTLANKGPITVTMGSIPAGCTSATGSGYVNSSNTSAPNPYLVITSTTFTGCTGPLGISVAINQVCDLVVSWDLVGGALPTVDDLFTDTVDGTLAVNNCLVVDGPGCDLTVNNSVDADFKEAIKSTTGTTTVQDLVISGPGLTADNVVGCFGMVPPNASINFNLTFNVTSANGPINFIP